MTGDWALLHRANRPRTGVTVPTDAQGVATAPKVIAGPKLGSVEVTAYIGVSREVKAVSPVRGEAAAPLITMHLANTLVAGEAN